VEEREGRGRGEERRETGGEGQEGGGGARGLME